MRCPSVIVLASFSCVASICAAVGASAQAPGNSKTRTGAQTAAAATSEGEKRFRTNCGRCHNPPEDISPREARAVIRQMRVRAMLSAEDERLILAYLAP